MARHNNLPATAVLLGFLLGPVGLLAAPVSHGLDAAAGAGVPDHWMQVSKLLAPDAASGDFFGGCVDVDGDTLVAGAHFDDDFANATGSAYVFERDPPTGRWFPVQKLHSSDPREAELFGFCVAIQGDTIFVGATISEFPVVTPSKVYVFERDPGTGVWSETQILEPADGAANDFGERLALDGDTLAVGATSDSDLGSEAGAVYLFERDPGSGDWLEVDKLLASDGSADDEFGGTLDLRDGTLVVGTNAFSDRRVAYVFERDPGTGAWLEVDILTPSGTDPFDNFGFGVTVEDGIAVVGAIDDDDAGNSAGAAYVFERDPGTGLWAETEKLIPFDGQDLSAYGQNVALRDGVLVVADDNDDTMVSSDGSLYVYERDPGTGSWALESKLVASDPGSFDHLGDSLAFDGTTILAGANDDFEGDRGAAYVFDRVGLGGSITGGTGRQAQCRNEDTAQSVLITLSGATSWDCAAAGLAAAPGERVTQRAVHTTTGNTISGAAAGLDLRQVRCRNQATGQAVTIDPGSATSWNCERAGLAITPGDLVTQTISGRAD